MTLRKGRAITSSLWITRLLGFLIIIFVLSLGLLTTIEMVTNIVDGAGETYRAHAISTAMLSGNTISHEPRVINNLEQYTETDSDISDTYCVIDTSRQHDEDKTHVLASDESDVDCTFSMSLNHEPTRLYITEEDSTEVNQLQVYPMSVIND